MTSITNNIKFETVDTYLSTRFEIKKHLRGKRVLIIAVFAIIIPIIISIAPWLSGVDFADSAGEFASSTLALIPFLIAISAVLFAGDAISSEFERKTGLLLFSTVQSRASILLGKYIAALIAILIGTSLYYAVVLLEIIIIYGLGDIPIELVQSYFIAFIYTTSVLSVVFLMSSLFNRSMISTVLSFFILIMLLPAIGAAFTAASIEPWFILSYYSSLITNVLFTGSSGFVTNVHGMDILADYSPDIYIGIAIMIAYTIVLLTSSIVLLNRKDMK
jgi:ABC-2 type transport system permease protein